MQILTRKQSLATIKLIKDAGKKLDTRIHNVGVSAIAHCYVHGDTTLISELCHAMPKSARGNALKAWATQYLPVKWDNKAFGGVGGFKLKADHGLGEMHWTTKVANTIKANASPFYDKKDTEASVYNPNSSVLTLLKRSSNEHVPFTTDSVEALTKLLAQARAEVEDTAANAA